MRFSVVIGMFVGLGAIVLGNLLEGGHIGALFQFTAALIVFGGTLGAVIVSHRWSDVERAIRALPSLFGNADEEDRKAVANQISTLAQLVRRESILSLEPQLEKMTHPFMKSVFRFVVDGVDPEVMKKMYIADLEAKESFDLKVSKVWSDAGGFAPTIGIIGAVLGLIHVMANVTDTSALGQGIAVAFVATIYGVASANIIFIPIANRLKESVRYDIETHEMILEGAHSIVSGMNPFVVEQKMKTYLRK